MKHILYMSDGCFTASLCQVGPSRAHKHASEQNHEPSIIWQNCLAGLIGYISASATEKLEQIYVVQPIPSYND
jgi:hypothetical protein